jgi:hypothetical protein
MSALGQKPTDMCGAKSYTQAQVRQLIGDKISISTQDAMEAAGNFPAGTLDTETGVTSYDADAVDAWINATGYFGSGGNSLPRSKARWGGPLSAVKPT